MTIAFTKATKKQAKLRMALIGPSGSGKTYSSLNIARSLGGKVALIDTERGSASKYADLFDFDALELDSFSPLTYVEAIQAADTAGYDVLVVDSLSHAWMGKDGALEQVDRIGKRIGGGNNFAAWRDVTPMHNQLVDAILGCRAHLIATMRSKTEYVQEKDERGKSVIRKVGLAPIQRDGLEYEFDVVGDLTLDNELVVSKTRCPLLTGKVIDKPGENIASVLKTWLDAGEPVPVADEQQVQAILDVEKKLVDAQAFTGEQFGQALRKEFGVNDVVSLTPAQADSLLERLNAKLAAVKPQDSNGDGGGSQFEIPAGVKS